VGWRRRVLGLVAPGLAAAGFSVEGSVGRIPRPSLFGEHGVPRETQYVDAVHDGLGIVVEVEAGRAFQSNAVFRDLIRASLIVDVRYLVLAVRKVYRFGVGQEGRDYDKGKALLDSIYANRRLGLPFEGVLLIGY
jgi:hypothetical protein